MMGRAWTAGLLAAGLGLTPPVPAEGQTWAVVVGIDDYSKESIPDLRYAGSDAKVFAQALQKLLKIAPDHLFLFSGDAADSNQIPNRLNLIYRLDWLSKTTRPDDVVIFYFAGHGAQVGSESFLLMKDSDNRSLETLKASALSKVDLNRLILRTSAARTLTVLDACRNDPTAGAGTVAGMDSQAQANFADSGTGREVVGLLSCSPGQRSWEWEEKKHGFFTYYLVEALQGSLKDKITPNSLAEYLTAKVNPSAQAVVHQPQTPRMFYDGPSTTSWVLGSSTQNPASLKELEVGAARTDLSSAQVANLEARLRAEELRRKQAEAKVEALEKRGPSVNGDEMQKLVVARDLALKELLDTRKQLEEARTQMTGRSGPSAEAVLIQAEHDQLVAENRVLKAKIVVLEEKLGGGGSPGGKSSARSFTLEENGPLSAEVKSLETRYKQQPTPELKVQLLKARIENESYDAKQYADELGRLGEVYEREVLTKLSDRPREAEQLKQELVDIGDVGTNLVNLGDCQQRRAQAGLSLAEKLLAVTEGSAPAGSEDEIQRLRSQIKQLEAEQNQRVLDLRHGTYRRRVISRSFREINALPGLGDIFDVVPVGPELQDLP
ncbi:MAG: caspase family protein [Vulcanimicrobiota bacterium]